MGKRKSAWRIWAKALGAKEGSNDREADIIAGIRTIIFVSYMVTNIAIVANAVRHWNDINYTQIEQLKLFIFSLKNLVDPVCWSISI